MSGYTVQRITHGTTTITDGWGNNAREEPATQARICDSRGRPITSVSLNALTLCLPEGSVYGMDATDDQIIRGVLGDEDIFTGEPSFPQHHGRATGKRKGSR